jgi:hypothetical protein
MTGRLLLDAGQLEHTATVPPLRPPATRHRPASNPPGGSSPRRAWARVTASVTARTTRSGAAKSGVGPEQASEPPHSPSPCAPAGGPLLPGYPRSHPKRR